MALYQSWIPAQLEWMVSPATFGCRIAANCEDLVATLASGAISVFAPTRQFANVTSALKKGCLEAACYRWLVQCDGPWDDVAKPFYLHGVFQLSPTELFVLIGDSPSRVPADPMAMALMQEAADRMECFRRNQERQRKRLEERCSSLDPDTNPSDQILKGMLDAFGSPDAPPPVPPRLSDLSIRPEHGSLITQCR